MSSTTYTEVLSLVETPKPCYSFPLTNALDYDSEAALPRSSMWRASKRKSTSSSKTAVDSQEDEISPVKTGIESQDKAAHGKTARPPIILQKRTEDTLKAKWNGAILSLLSGALFWDKKTDRLAHDHIHGYDRIHYDCIEDYPPGFPRLAAFLNSDDDFAILRRFGKLHMRMLVQLQVELTLLEEELEKMDKCDDGSEFEYRLRSMEHKETWNQSRKELENKILVKLHEYDKLLLQDSQLRALSRPSDSNHGTVFNWIWNTKHLDIGEFDFIYQIEDFVSLAKPRQKDSNDPLEVSWDRWPGSQIKKFLQGNAEKRRTKSNTTKYFSQRRLIYLTHAFITILAISMLLIPVSILFLVPMSKIWMVITVLMSSITFSTSLFAFTNSKRQEVFLGTATYCAVIVAFLGNFQNGASNANQM